MNQTRDIFTPEQFRAQAVELSQAMAELQRSQEIDPHDPFGNETEFHDYQPDYGEIVPQIRLPGCHIPLKPNSREKGRIRRFLNIVGGLLLAHLILSNVLAVGLEQLVLLLFRVVDTMAAGELPEDYSSIASQVFWASSSMIAMNLLAYGSLNVLTTWLGCRITKLRIPNLFRTHDFTPFLGFSYVCIILLLQFAMGYTAMGIDWVFEQVGVTLYEPDLTSDDSLRGIVISAVYSIIVAPITEELLMRGFVQKNLCRVSQHFGIITTAFLFGVWHENISQFLLAFAGGLFFGYIAAKHNSLIPSIICHMVVNTFAEVFTLCEDQGWLFAESIINVLYMALALAGLLFLIRLLLVERFPSVTPHQAERGLRQLLASPLLVGVIVCHIGIAVLAIVSATMEAAG